MYNKVPNLLSRRYPDRAARWQKVVAFGGGERTAAHPVGTVRYELPAHHPSAVGKKIAFFSDLHACDTARSRALTARAAAEIAAFQPDYLICGGDAVVDCTDLDCARERLSGFPNTPVKLAVPGNWERSKLWLEPDFWREFYRKSGFQLLVNDLFQDDSFAFFGVDDPKGGQPRGGIPWPNEVEKILLAHNPDTAIAIDFTGLLGEVDLVLCGHTHAGQVRLPGVGALLTSSLYGRKFDAGMFRRRKSETNMIISSGLGTASFPIRFHCPPEVVLLTFASLAHTKELRLA